jgi:hypothetical protein
MWRAARRLQVNRLGDPAIGDETEESMCHPITLEHYAEPRKVGVYILNLGEILVCLGCEEAASYKNTVRPATPVKEEFWARFRDDVKSLLLV